MTANHIFVASGEACPICDALAGMMVEPGYRPHSNCNCNTVLHKDGGECQFDYEESDRWQLPYGWRVEFSLTVTCPDGTVREAPGVTLDLDRVIEGENDDLLEDLAEDACEDLCDSDDDEWLCC